jgi:hypothetical protein
MRSRLLRYGSVPLIERRLRLLLLVPELRLLARLFVLVSRFSKTAVHRRRQPQRARVRAVLDGSKDFVSKRRPASGTI